MPAFEILKHTYLRRYQRWVGPVRVALVPLFLFGCVSAPYVRLSVDSLSRTDVGRSYVLLPGNKDTTELDLQFQEFARYIHRALALRGFHQAQGGGTAETLIFVAYGIGDPQTHQYSYSVPLFGQTGISGSTTIGSVYGGGFSSTTTYTPTYGVTGYATHVGTVTLYSRFIRLQAYDRAAYDRTKNLEEVWRSTIISVGKVGDLRRVFPVMTAGSAKHLATNTGQWVEIKLDEQDASVQAIKGMADEPRQTGPRRPVR